MTKSDRHTEGLMAGLLGPAGPELTCEQCFELLDIYVEHEVARENADRRVLGMREHLQGCPACAEEHESLRDLLCTLSSASTGKNELADDAKRL